jgi:hypothetical protein
LKKAGLAIVASACGYLLASSFPRKTPRGAKESRASIAALSTPLRISDRGTREYTTKFILPAWLLAGLMDYLWHRKSGIEKTSGPAESAMHSLMMAEGAAPVLGGLFLDVNAAVLAAMIVASVVHQATAVWDVTYTVKRRVISPGEQHIHSALEMLPFCALSLMIVRHYDQFLALFGMGGRPDFELRKKRDRLHPGYVAAMLGVTGTLQFLYTEEFWRCLRDYRKGLTGTETPAAARHLYGPAEETDLFPAGAGGRH